MTTLPTTPNTPITYTTRHRVSRWLRANTWTALYVAAIIVMGTSVFVYILGAYGYDTGYLKVVHVAVLVGMLLTAIHWSREGSLKKREGSTRENDQGLIIPAHGESANTSHVTSTVKPTPHPPYIDLSSLLNKEKPRSRQWLLFTVYLVARVIIVSLLFTLMFTAVYDYVNFNHVLVAYGATFGGWSLLGKVRRAWPGPAWRLVDLVLIALWAWLIGL